MNPGSEQCEAFIRQQGGVPASAHSPECRGSRLVLTSYPPQDGGVIGCTCGADRRLQEVIRKDREATK